MPALKKCKKLLEREFTPEVFDSLELKIESYKNDELKYLQKGIQPKLVENDVVRLPVYWSDGMALIHVKNGVSLEADFEKNKV